MKRLLLSVLLLSSCTAKAQVPDYFADSPEWRQKTLCYEENDTKIWEFVYYLNGDSIVNNILWKKVFKRGTYEISGMSGSGGYSYNNFYMLVRQDSSRMYTLDQFGEELLYEFDLSVGDTLPATVYYESTTNVIDSIEDVVINGTTRKKFYIFNQQYALNGSYIIEGMGSDVGLFEPIESILNCGHYFKCYRVNNTNEVGTDCDFEVSIDEPILQNDISFGPNPVTSLLTIEFPEKHSLECLKICNSDGRTIPFVDSEISTGSARIHMEGIASGMLFVTLTFSDGQQIHQNILKK